MHTEARGVLDAALWLFVVFLSIAWPYLRVEDWQMSWIFIRILLTVEWWTQSCLAMVLKPAGFMGSNSCLTKILTDTPECTRPTNWQNFCFYGGGHACWWPIYQVYLIGSSWLLKGFNPLIPYGEICHVLLFLWSYSRLILRPDRRIFHDSLISKACELTALCFFTKLKLGLFSSKSWQSVPHDVNKSVTQTSTHVQGFKCSRICSTCNSTRKSSNNARVLLLERDHNVLNLSRALSLPCLPNSIWKHNERMTGLTTLTSKLLHQCFHPLAFSFSTHHFPLLCNWETMTTSESRGWSYMKEAEGVQPTVMVVGTVAAKTHGFFLSSSGCF